MSDIIYDRPLGHTQNATSVSGLAALGKVLSELPVKLQKRVIRAAVRQGGNVVLKAARAAVPELDARSDNPRYYVISHGIMSLTGDLKKSLRLTTTFMSRDKSVVATIKDGTYYGWFVEHGTVHASPQPFMRPALEHNVEAVLGIIRDAIANNLQKAVDP